VRKYGRKTTHAATIENMLAIKTAPAAMSFSILIFGWYSELIKSAKCSMLVFKASIVSTKVDAAKIQSQLNNGIWTKRPVTQTQRNTTH